MAVGVVEVDDVADCFSERLLGFVLHHDGVAKAAVETLEDVPTVVPANGIRDLALVVSGEDFASSSRLNSASFLSLQLVVLRQSTRGALMLLHRIEDLTGRDAGEYAVPVVVGDVLFHSLSAWMTHALVEPMDLLHNLGSDACACLVPQAAERNLSSIRIDSSIPSNDSQEFPRLK